MRDRASIRRQLELGGVSSAPDSGTATGPSGSPFTNWCTNGSCDARISSGVPCAIDDAGGHEIHVVDDVERLLHVVRDDDRGRAERVVELADQVADHAERDRIEPGERLVVHDEHAGRARSTRASATRRAMPPESSAGMSRVRAAQADRVQLHHHQVVDQRFRQVGVLAQLKGDVVEDRQDR